ncbi:MAG: polysaccharide biosynthesis tyrosine autokinase [Verrucomicrobia bacterium]|nr:polysaccharide biosynthesis tyrosine autokinase [Verrucomicrobiota bacterium]
MDSTKTAPSQESPLHFLDYWRIIRIRKTVILAVFLLVLLTTAGVTMMLKPSYRSTARIEVAKEAKVVNPLGETQNQLAYDPYFVATEFEKIQSTEVLYEVIDKLNLQQKWAKYYNPDNEPISDADAKQIVYQRLRRNLDVNLSRNTSLIEISAYSHDRDEAAEIANLVATQYRDWRMLNRTNNTWSGIKVLKENLAKQTEKVRDLQAKVDSKREELGVTEAAGDGPSYATSIEREMASSRANQFTYAQAEYVLYSTKLEELKRLQGEELRRAILTALPGEEVLPKYLLDLAAVDQRLAQLRGDLGEAHPEFLKTVALRQEVERQVNDRVTGMMAGLEKHVASLRARYEELQRGLDEGKSRVIEEAKKWREFYQLKRDLESEQRIRDALYLRSLQEEIDVQIPQADIVLFVDNAQPSLRPVRPNIIVNLTLGAVFGLVMGIGLAFFIEYLDTSVKTIDDVERALSAPVLGVIPQNVGLLMDEGPDSPHAEAYRVLRTNVLFSRKRPDANSLTVVSGGAGEGKSTTIFNLATVFAQQGQRVLLVDSDLRRPSLHKFMKTSNSVGLTNYLLKQNQVEEVIQTTKVPLLDFLPSGKLPSSSLGILNSQRMKDFIQDVKSRYDFVFFDSPPIMGVSDASILASEVDLAILVVQYRKYPQAMTLRAKQMVEKVGGSLLGVVLNNINISQDSYYYYYSGYYYDYYSKSSDSEPDGAAKGSGAKAAAKAAPDQPTPVGKA